ncbi:hypothetical protein HDU76_001799 [Blyttiomyces sp. JEL0837]|nr:hypothetical protein HDU76_001799 [Blyttiomyces sp. JEL0837]
MKQRCSDTTEETPEKTENVSYPCPSCGLRLFWKHMDALMTLRSNASAIMEVSDNESDESESDSEGGKSSSDGEEVDQDTTKITDSSSAIDLTKNSRLAINPDIDGGRVKKAEPPLESRPTTKVTKTVADPLRVKGSISTQDSEVRSGKVEKKITIKKKGSTKAPVNADATLKPPIQKSQTLDLKAFMKETKPRAAQPRRKIISLDSPVALSPITPETSSFPKPLPVMVDSDDDLLDVEEILQIKPKPKQTASLANLDVLHLQFKNSCIIIDD